MTNPVLPQKLAFLKDVEDYGNYQCGFYKGIEWETIRNLNDPGLSHWRGYLLIPEEYQNVSDKIRDDVNAKAHGGITFGEDFSSKIGFDCAHGFDYVSNQEGDDTMAYINKTFLKQSEDYQITLQRNQNKIFRDFLYVKNCLFEMIDALVPDIDQ